MDLNIKTKKCSSTILTSAISLVLLTASHSAAAGSHDKSTSEQEQCAGIVKAGMNDCGSVEHACAGLNTEDGYDTDWLWLPKGTCSKILGTHVIHTAKMKDSST